MKTVIDLLAHKGNPLLVSDDSPLLNQPRFYEVQLQDGWYQPVPETTQPESAK